MNLNELPQDIQEAARALADAILAETQAQAYQSAIQTFEDDPQAVALEKRFMDLYAELIARQQKGEILSQQYLAPFYTLRNEYYAHPLVVARNDALGAFKPLLAEAGEQISIQIGMDFTELAEIEQEILMNIKIAAVSDDGQTISQHFGRAKYYTVLTIENGQIIAREQREKMGHAQFAGEEHTEDKADPRGHGFAPAEQDRHFQMAEAIRDCQILLARGMGSGAYYSMEQVGIKPVITDFASIDEAALQAAQGVIVDHKEKLH